MPNNKRRTKLGEMFFEDHITRCSRMQAPFVKMNTNLTGVPKLKYHITQVLEKELATTGSISFRNFLYPPAFISVPGNHPAILVNSGFKVNGI